MGFRNGAPKSLLKTRACSCVVQFRVIIIIMICRPVLEIQNPATGQINDLTPF